MGADELRAAIDLRVKSGDSVGLQNLLDRLGITNPSRQVEYALRLRKGGEEYEKVLATLIALEAERERVDVGFRSYLRTLVGLRELGASGEEAARKERDSAVQLELARMRKETAEREERWERENATGDLERTKEERIESRRRSREREQLEAEIAAKNADSINKFNEELERANAARDKNDRDQEARVEAVIQSLIEQRRALQQEHDQGWNTSAGESVAAARTAAETVALVAAIEKLDNQIAGLRSGSETLDDSTSEPAQPSRSERLRNWFSRKKRNEDASADNDSADNESERERAKARDREEAENEEEDAEETLKARKEKRDRDMQRMFSSGSALAAGAGVPEAIPAIQTAGNQMKVTRANNYDNEVKKLRKDFARQQEDWDPISKWRVLPLFLVLFALLSLSELQDPLLFYAAVGVSLLAILLCLTSKRFQVEFLSANGLAFVLFFGLHVLLANGILFSENAYPMSINTIFLVAVLTIVIAVASAFFSKSFSEARQGTSTVILVIAATIVAYCLPWLFHTWFPGPDGKFENVAFIIVTILPVGALYMLSRISEGNDDGWAAGLLFLFKLTFFLFVSGFLILGLLQADKFLPKGIPGYEGSDPTQMREGAIGVVTTTWEKITEKFKGEVRQIQNPGAYYTGQVEKNKEKPLGVTIVNPRVIDKSVSNDSDILAFAGVTAKSFIGESINVVPTCSMDKKDSPAAWVDPTTIEIIFGSTKTFECTFSPKEITVEQQAQQWKRGSYGITMSATFPFETWAYIPYTFVDEERWRNIVRQGKDGHQVLGIAQNPAAIYTSGPITVGMGGTPQPVLIRPDKDPIIPAGTHVGITVDSAYLKGELRRVDSIEIKVPRPFKFKSCDREWTGEPQQDPNDEIYSDYIFTNPSNDPLLTYTSITCQLEIPLASREDALKLVTTSDKAERSFVGVVKYQYTVKDKVTAQVK